MDDDIEIKSEIKTVFKDNVCIGFIVDTRVLLDWCQDTPAQWSAAPDILKPVWAHGYNSPDDAIAYLEEQEQ